jgi:hypothetical protein
MMIGYQQVSYGVKINLHRLANTLSPEMGRGEQDLRQDAMLNIGKEVMETYVPNIMTDSWGIGRTFDSRYRRTGP